MNNVLKTYMSPVFHREPANPQERDEESLRPLPNEQGKQRCLLDDLLDGGIYIPNQVVENRLKNGPPYPGLFVLLTGPPGSGKSIFALELAYRLAINENPGLSAGSDKGLKTLYISAESESINVIENAKKLGWEKAEERIVPISSKNNYYLDTTMPRVILYGRENIEASNFPDPTKYFEDAIKKWENQWKQTKKEMQRFSPDVIVIDSLNVLPWKKDDILQAIVHSCIKNVLLVIVVLDCNPDSDMHDYWEFFADLVVGFTYRSEKEYLVRKLRILKARFQDHTDGEHRLKINAAPEPTPPHLWTKEAGTDKPIRTEVTSPPIKPAHPMSPFIKEGGIFTFPSVHRYLSQTRKPLPPTDFLPTPFEALNGAIEGHGFPTSRCTALVGSRGSMKSHLAYYTMLKFLTSDPMKRALLISLRDDENAAVATLAQIWANQRGDDGHLLDPNIETLAAVDRLKRSESAVRALLSKDKLEILYFWPGYISPEEFFHLVVVSADRQPRNMPSVGLAVINGLEQLEARFPLCAREDMFVSGLITLLTVKGIATIVASGGRSALGTVPAGLLPMADLVLESSFRLIQSKTVNPLIGLQSPKPAAEEFPHVVYEVIRGLGAREMRTKLLFYMGRETDKIAEPRTVWPGSVKVTRLAEHVTVGQMV